MFGTAATAMLNGCYRALHAEGQSRWVKRDTAMSLPQKGSAVPEQRETQSKRECLLCNRLCYHVYQTYLSSHLNGMCVMRCKGQESNRNTMVDPEGHTADGPDYDTYLPWLCVFGLRTRLNVKGGREGESLTICLKNKSHVYKSKSCKHIYKSKSCKHG